MTSFRYAVFFKCAMFVSTTDHTVPLGGGGILSNEFLKVKGRHGYFNRSSGGGCWSGGGGGRSWS